MKRKRTSKKRKHVTPQKPLKKAAVASHPSRPRKRKENPYEKLLSLISTGFRHSEALRACGLIWRDVGLRIAADPEYARRHIDAERIREEWWQRKREEEADRRAVDGWDEPVYQGGMKVGTIKRFSDTLLCRQMSAGNPAKYATRQVHSGDVTMRTIEDLILDLQKGPDDDEQAGGKPH